LEIDFNELVQHAVREQVREILAPHLAALDVFMRLAGSVAEVQPSAPKVRRPVQPQPEAPAPTLEELTKPVADVAPAEPLAATAQETAVPSVEQVQRFLAP
jgi:hypothetical protein